MGGTTYKEQYIASLYWAFTTMTTIGYGDIRAVTANERIFATFCMIFGGVTFTYGVTRMVAIVSTMGKSQINLMNQLESLNEWAQYHDLTDDLIGDVKTYLHYKNTQMYYDEDSIIHSLSIPLQKRILKQIYAKSMDKIELFKSIKNASFLAEIMLRLKSEFAQPYQLICKEGDVADSMYMIRKGIAAAFQGKAVRDIRTALLLRSGQGFDEIGLLADNVLRTASVVSLDWCDLGYLTKRDFAALIDYFPKQRKLLEAYALDKIEEYKKAIRGRSFARIPKVSHWGGSSARSDHRDSLIDLGDEDDDYGVADKERESSLDTEELNKVHPSNICSKANDGQSEESGSGSAKNGLGLLRHQNTHDLGHAPISIGKVNHEMLQSTEEVKPRVNTKSVQRRESQSILTYLKRIDEQLGEIRDRVDKNSAALSNHAESVSSLNRQLSGVKSSTTADIEADIHILMTAEAAEEQENKSNN